MEKYLKPLQGLKDRAVKSIIAYLIKAFVSPQKGNLKRLIPLIVFCYILICGVWVNAQFLLDHYTITLIVFFGYVLIKVAIGWHKSYKEAKALLDQHEKELGI